MPKNKCYISGLLMCKHIESHCTSQIDMKRLPSECEYVVEMRFLDYLWINIYSLVLFIFFLQCEPRSKRVKLWQILLFVLERNNARKG